MLLWYNFVCNFRFISILQVPESIKRVEKITGKSVAYYNIDMLDKDKLNKVFKQHKFSAVMHFAGLKSVSESIAKPMEYYEINLGSE